MSGSDLIAWLRAHDMTAAELALRLGVERSTVYRWKRRGNAPVYLALALEALDWRLRSLRRAS